MRSTIYRRLIVAYEGIHAPTSASIRSEFSSALLAGSMIIANARALNTSYRSADVANPKV